MDTVPEDEEELVRMFFNGIEKIFAGLEETFFLIWTENLQVVEDYESDADDETEFRKGGSHHAVDANADDDDQDAEDYSLRVSHSFTIATKCLLMTSL